MVGDDGKSSDKKLGVVRGTTPWRATGAAEPTRFLTRESDDCETPTGKRGIFRNNRGLVITLIDLFFVTVLFIIYLAVLRPMANQVKIGPYVVDFDVEQTVGMTILTTEVQVADPVLGPRPELPQEQPIVTISVRGQSVSDLAPRTDAERRFVMRFPDGAGGAGRDPEPLEIEIRIGAETQLKVIELR